jgi:peptidoglycan hydrolase-like protein with peptidoglycan-binding domain
MRKIVYLAVAALFGFGLAAAPADAQQRPMGSSGSSTSSSPSASTPAKSTPAKKSAASKKMPSDSVKALQTALNKNGAQLKVDGMMGPGTRAALKKYQAANGLKATGREDAATKAKLGV